MSDLRLAFAGDRDIALWALEFILSQRQRPLALLLSDRGRASHDHELAQRCAYLESDSVLRGAQFRRPEGVARLRELNLDYIICVHFPYVVPAEVLTIPRHGVLNLHPAFLPYNRGWHTPSWAILDGTPIGATLHFMDEGIDSGDIIDQQELEVSPGDTANTLYQRLKRLELDVFKRAWPHLVSRSYRRQPQDPGQGTAHKRRDLFQEPVQRIDPGEQVRAGELIRRLRALTTNSIQEAAYYQINGRRFRIQVTIHEDTPAG